MPCHKHEYSPLSWFMKGFEVQGRKRDALNLLLPFQCWDDTAAVSSARDEMMPLHRFAGTKYWPSGTSVLTGLKEMLEESQTKIEEKKKQRRSRTPGIF